MNKIVHSLQFAHGKEELRSTLFPTTKNKSEVSSSNYKHLFSHVVYE